MIPIKKTYGNAIRHKVPSSHQNLMQNELDINRYSEKM